jgi:lipopolysaccharide transport system ATP-binding protein
MSKPIISIDRLGKRYRITHQVVNRRYVTLRDVIARKLAAPFRVLNGRLRKSASGSRDSGRRHAPPGIEDFWALKDVSFDIHSGDVLGVIGRNGAGKSTLLKILSRITEPTEGRVRINGRVASLLEVGTGFHPELTGRENVFLNGAILGMKRAEIRSKFDELVAFAEIDKFLDTPVKRYSSGMYVRLAFSVAAHLEPQILIVDEVLAVGDAQFQKKCLGKVDEVTKGGRTVVLVSHNLGMIRKLCTTGVLLEKGRMTQFGSTEEVTNTYRGRAEEDQAIRSRFDTVLSGREMNVRVECVEVFGDEQDSTPTAGTMLTVRLRVMFRQEVLNPNFIVRIRNVEEQPIVYLSTSPICGITTGKCSGLVTCTLRLDQIPLTGGKYEISVGVGLPHICFIIPVTPIGYFWIEGTDCYNSGVILDNKECIIAPKHEWIIKHSD